MPICYYKTTLHKHPQICTITASITKHGNVKYVKLYDNGYDRGHGWSNNLERNALGNRAGHGPRHGRYGRHGQQLQDLREQISDGSFRHHALLTHS